MTFQENLFLFYDDILLNPKCKINYSEYNMIMLTCDLFMLTCNMIKLKCNMIYGACWHNYVACQNNYVLWKCVKRKRPHDAYIDWRKTSKWQISCLSSEMSFFLFFRISSKMSENDSCKIKSIIYWCDIWKLRSSLWLNMNSGEEHCIE